jgi:hypothetical protein
MCRRRASVESIADIVETEEIATIVDISITLIPVIGSYRGVHHTELKAVENDRSPYHAAPQENLVEYDVIEEHVSPLISQPCSNATKHE